MVILFRPPQEESGMYELNKKPLFVYGENDFDQKEQTALHEALNPVYGDMEEPRHETVDLHVPKDAIELLHERCVFTVNCNTLC